MYPPIGVYRVIKYIVDKCNLQGIFFAVLWNEQTHNYTSNWFKQ